MLNVIVALAADYRNIVGVVFDTVPARVGGRAGIYRDVFGVVFDCIFAKPRRNGNVGARIADRIVADDARINRGTG